MARMLVEQFGSEVPASVDNLQKMPGVGRETANVIASVILITRQWRLTTCFQGISSFRISAFYGYNAFAVEKELMKYIPKNLVHKRLTGSSCTGGTLRSEKPEMQRMPVDRLL